MAHKQHSPPRKWYCSDDLTDEYVRAYHRGGEQKLRMAQKLRILRAIVVNVGLIGITVFALSEGADPTLVGTSGILSLALYNGVEVADYIALMQAMSEVKAGAGGDSGGGGGGGGDSDDA